MSLTDRLDRDQEAWKPTEVGEKLEGVLIDFELRTSDYSGDDYPVLTVETDDGREVVWYASQAGPRKQILRANPQIGERVGVSFRGLGEAKPGQSEPKRFRFLVDRPLGMKPPERPAAPESGDDAPPVAGDDDIPF